MPQTPLKMMKLLAKHHNQPIMNNFCTVMLLSNLADPQWVSVNCRSKMLGDVLCRIPKAQTSHVIKDKDRGQLNHLSDTDCVILKGKCHLFLWTTRIDYTAFRIFELISIKSIKRYNLLFNAVSSEFPPFFSNNYQYLIFYTKASETLLFKQQVVVHNNMKGLVVSSRKSVKFQVHDNVFECNHNIFISYVFLCDGILDCPGNNLLDEAESMCWKTKCQEKHLRSDCFLYHERNIKSRYIENSRLNGNTSYELKIKRKFDDKEYSFVNCSHFGKLACTEQSVICYDISEICSYILNEFKVMIPCESGGHLQNCKFFECNMMFKCPGYYCIPWYYVCDGKMGLSRGL